MPTPKEHPPDSWWAMLTQGLLPSWKEKRLDLGMLVGNKHINKLSIPKLITEGTGHKLSKTPAAKSYLKSYQAQHQFMLQLCLKSL